MWARLVINSNTFEVSNGEYLLCFWKQQIIYLDNKVRNKFVIVKNDVISVNRRDFGTKTLMFEKRSFSTFKNVLQQTRFDAFN